MKTVVYKRIPESNPELVREAGQYGVADLHESLGVVPGRMALLNGGIRPLNAGLRIAGAAVTVYNYPGDGLMSHKAVQMVGPGQVLVFANGGASPSTMFAEMLALAARRNQVAGVVVDGSIRDTDALREMQFPIWFASIHSAHAARRGPGAINIPIVCGGVQIEPGDIIVADGDGVICVPRVKLEVTVRAARERSLREVDMRSRMEKGESLYDIAGIGPAAAAACLEEYDMTWNGAD